MQWNAFNLKLVGILIMLVDHIGKLFFPDIFIIRIVGRIAFPLFAWTIANGYLHTRDVRRYTLRLFLFALLSQIPYTWAFQGISSNPIDYLTSLNVMFTLLLGLLAIVCYEQLSEKRFGLMIMLLLSIVSGLLNMDYGAIGVISVFLFHVFCKHSEKLLICQIALFSANYIVKYIYMLNSEGFLMIVGLVIFTIIPFGLLRFYNGEAGIRSRYFFYIFYPGHLLVLYGIHYLLLTP